MPLRLYTTCANNFLPVKQGRACSRSIFPWQRVLAHSVDLSQRIANKNCRWQNDFNPWCPRFYPIERSIDLR